MYQIPRNLFKTWIVFACGCCITSDSEYAITNVADASNYVREIAADAPLGHWRLSGNSGSPTSGAIEGDPDGATTFDGGMALKLLGVDIASGPEFTVEMWVKASRGPLLSYAVGDDSEVLAIGLDKELSIKLLGVTSQFPVEFSDREWHHFAMSWSGADGKLTIMFDGRALPPQIVASSRQLPGNGTLVVGHQQKLEKRKAGEGLSGLLDEVVWYDRLVPPCRMLSHVLVAQRIRPPTTDQSSLAVEVRGRTGPFGAIVSTAVSPDSSIAVLGSADNTAGLWELGTGNFLRPLTRHTDIVDLVAFSADGRYVATATSGSFDMLKDPDLSVKLWETSTGKLVYDLHGHTSAVASLAFGPDGRFLASGGRDKTIRVWDTSDGKVIHTFQGHADDVISVAFSPDGRRLASGAGAKVMVGEVVGSKRSAVAKVWDLKTGSCAFDVLDRQSRFGAVSFSPDGKLLVTAGDNGVSLRDAVSGQLVRNLTSGSAFSVGFDSAGRRILAGCADGKARLWNVATGVLVREFLGNANRPWVAALDPLGNFVATTDAASKIEIWAADTGMRRHTLEEHTDRVSTLTFSPDGTRLLSGSNDRTAMVWNVATGKRLKTLAARTDEVDINVISQDRRFIVLGGPDGTLRVWNIAEGKLHCILQTHSGKVTSSAISSDGRLALSGASDGTVALSDLRTRNVKMLKQHRGIISQVAFSPDGRTAISAGSDAEVNIYDAANGQFHQTLSGKAMSINAIAVSSDSQKIVSGDLNGAIIVWDLARSIAERTLSGHKSAVKFLRFSSDGNSLVSQDDDTLILWDFSSGKLTRTFRSTKGNTTCGELSPNGRTVAIGGSFGSVSLWDSRSGALISILQEDKLPSLSQKFFESTVRVSFSPDGKYLFSYGRGTAIRVWDVDKPGLHLVLDRPIGMVRSAVFDPHGRFIVAGNEDGTCILWDLNTGLGISMTSVKSEWVIYDDKGLFDSSPAGFALVAAVQGTRSFGIDQLAMTSNRPDLLIDRFGLGSPEILNHLKSLHSRRLRQAGLAEKTMSEPIDMPDAQVLGTQLVPTPDAIDIEIALRDRRGLRSYQIYVNDVPIFGGFGKQVAGNRARIRERVVLTPGTNKIEIAAINTRGQESLRALVVEEMPGATKGTLYYLGFGVSKYKNHPRIPNLSFADKDADDLAELFSRMEGVYRDRRVKTFTNSNVTVQSIKDAKSFLLDSTPEDTVVLFISGHGVHDSDMAATYFYATHETDPDNLSGTAANFELIERLLNGIAPRRKIFLMDTCQSGESFDETTAVVNNFTGHDVRLNARLVAGGIFGMRNVGKLQSRNKSRDFLKLGDRFIDLDLQRRTGAIVVSSCRGDEASWESVEYRNGIFTASMLRALSSSAADTDRNGLVSTQELRLYVEKEVPKLSGNRQHPTVDRDNIYQKFDFPIVKALKTAD